MSLDSVRVSLAKTRSRLEQTTSLALDIARSAGADEVSVELSHGESRTVLVRNRVQAEKSLRLASEIVISVSREGRHATTRTADLSRPGLEQALHAALEIASVTAVDPAGGLADASQLATELPELDLYHPCDMPLETMAEHALRTEAAAFEDGRIVTSNGASVQIASGLSLLATSRGFMGHAPWSIHSISCIPVAAGDQGRQIGFWSDAARAFVDLTTAECVGRVAASRAADSLGARQIPTQTCAVLFEPAAALTLLGDFVGAASGDALYRSSSFLAGQLGERLFPAHIRIAEDPFRKKAMGSRCFDSSGIAGSRRNLVDSGRLQGYFLSLYAARRLGMTPTGNGYGTGNLDIRSELTQAGDDFQTMLRKLDRGLVVRDMTGGGVNRLSGDFSRAVKGFWVENGEIRFPVEGITLASNLRRMFGGMRAIGADALTRGAMTSGSWLVDEMKVGGR